MKTNRCGRNPACLSAILDGSGQGRVSEYRGKQLGLHKGNMNNHICYALPSNFLQIIWAGDLTK